MRKPLIVFDMDGVLVDVTESYREDHRSRPWRHFTGSAEIGPDAEIQDYKNSGGCERRLEAFAPP